VNQSNVYRNAFDQTSITYNQECDNVLYQSSTTSNTAVTHLGGVLKMQSVKNIDSRAVKSDISINWKDNMFYISLTSEGKGSAVVVSCNDTSTISITTSPTADLGMVVQISLPDGREYHFGPTIKCTHHTDSVTQTVSADVCIHPVINEKGTYVSMTGFDKCIYRSDGSMSKTVNSDEWMRTTSNGNVFHMSKVCKRINSLRTIKTTILDTNIVKYIREDGVKHTVTEHSTRTEYPDAIVFEKSSNSLSFSKTGFLRVEFSGSDYKVYLDNGIIVHKTHTDDEKYSFRIENVIVLYIE